MAKHKRQRAAPEATGEADTVKDTSPKVPQRTKIDFQLHIHGRDDLTERQRVIEETMLHRDTRCVFIDGVYGSGKTYLAVMAALKLLNAGKVDQLLYIRNPVESSSTGKLGFVPGSIAEKVAPYAEPFHSKLAELLDKGDVTRLEKDGRLEVVPLGFVRGRSWNCKAIIVDEASSMAWDDILLILTRCGEFTRVFFVGDSLNQNDIGSKAGFRRMFETFADDESRANGVHTFELRDEADVVRSQLLRFVLRKTGILKPTPSPSSMVREPMFPVIAHESGPNRV